MGLRGDRQDSSVGFTQAQTTHDNERKVLQFVLNVKLVQTISFKASRKRKIFSLTLEYALSLYWTVTIASCRKRAKSSI